MACPWQCDSDLKLDHRIAVHRHRFSQRERHVLSMYHSHSGSGTGRRVAVALTLARGWRNTAGPGHRHPAPVNLKTGLHRRPTRSVVMGGPGRDSQA